jgi:serine protease AprX
MAVTNAAIGADLVQAGLVPGAAALTGAGVTVAVLDTGVARVPELKGRLLASVDFTDERGNGADRFGHGTHVAGIVAGGGSAAHAGTVGVAPGAGIVNVKVLDDSGMGRVSDVIAGIDWTIAHASRFDIRVVTLAMGAVMTQSWRDDPLCQAVARAYRAGLVVVASAGNHGKAADGRTV